jgi:hypothetical protein
MSVPPEEPRADAETAAERECPRCGSAASPQQDYCLECGARLPPPEAALAGPAGQIRGGARESLLTVLVAFLVAVLAAAAVVGVQLAREDTEHPFFVATNEQGLTEPEQEEPPMETALPPDEVEVEEEFPPEDEPLEDEPEPEPQQQELIDWPVDTDGWTVILASLPTSAGPEAATVRAREARDAGLSEVGVLTSAEFASLHPGYFIVFSGVHATQAEAQAAVPAARDAGFGDAYPRQITR